MVSPTVQVMNSACQPIAVLMMTVSDNSATDMLLACVGKSPVKGRDAPVRSDIHRGAVRHALAPHEAGRHGPHAVGAATTSCAIPEAFVAARNLPADQPPFGLSPPAEAIRARPERAELLSLPRV